MEAKPWKKKQRRKQINEKIKYAPGGVNYIRTENVNYSQINLYFWYNAKHCMWQTLCVKTAIF